MTKQMTETKLELTNRLTEAGRWEEASKFRAECRERHKSAGKTKREANSLAWQEMAKEYPPQPESVVESKRSIRQPASGVMVRPSIPRSG